MTSLKIRGSGHTPTCRPKCPPRGIDPCILRHVAFAQQQIFVFDRNLRIERALQDEHGRHRLAQQPLVHQRDLGRESRPSRRACARPRECSSAPAPDRKDIRDCPAVSSSDQSFWKNLSTGGDCALHPRSRACSTIAILVAQYAPQLTPCIAMRFLSISGRDCA